MPLVRFSPVQNPPSKMNVEFLQILQSMAEVEKKPEFRPKRYAIVASRGYKKGRQVDPSSGAVPVVLKHPKNVIVVASPTGKAPPPAAGEKRVAQLSTAIKMASDLSSIGKRGCSIVVHEGLYINPTAALGEYGLPELKWKAGFSLEIIGIEEVRILNTSPFAHTYHFKVCDIQLTLKNLTIYGRREASGSTGHESAVTVWAEGTVIDLVDVRIHSPDEIPLYSTNGAFLGVSDCDLFDFWSSFRVDQDAMVEMTNCRFFFERASDVSYGNVFGKSRAIFNRCQFIGDHVQLSPDVFSGMRTLTSRPCALNVGSGGCLDMFECSVTGFQHALQIKDSHSRAGLDRCKLSHCTIAIMSMMNSVVSVTECELATNYVLQLELNVTGKVEFRDNSVKTKAPPFSPCSCCAFSFDPADKDGTAVIRADRDPSVVEHDFAYSRIELFEPREWEDNSFEAKRGIPRRSKQCLHCWVSMLDMPEAKFKYCSRCRKVCYCSKECQQANWKDHKLVCKRN